MGDDVFFVIGIFELMMGDSIMDIDLLVVDQNGDGDGFIDVSELVNVINDFDDNSGVLVVLVKIDGIIMIMFIFDSIGVQSVFLVSVMGYDVSNDSISVFVVMDVFFVQDVIIYFGSVIGFVIINSSNIFDDVIFGVIMIFIEVSDFDSDFIIFNISEDFSVSQEKVQIFVDVYNILIDMVDLLIIYGDDSISVGVFVGDVGFSLLVNQFDDIVYVSYNGVLIVDYGIIFDFYGYLQIDFDQFNDEMVKNFDGLIFIFVGDNSMVVQMDDLINIYMDFSNGIIILCQQNIDDQMSKIQDEGDQFIDIYNVNYDCYLEEYINMLVEVYIMKVSMVVFV